MHLSLIISTREKTLRQRDRASGRPSYVSLNMRRHRALLFRDWHGAGGYPTTPTTTIAIAVLVARWEPLHHPRPRYREDFINNESMRLRSPLIEFWSHSSPSAWDEKSEMYFSEVFRARGWDLLGWNIAKGSGISIDLWEKIFLVSYDFFPWKLQNWM